MYCKNCGKLLAGDERFCSNCGTKVENEKEAIGTQDVKTVEIESFPTSKMVWDLDDFEAHLPETEVDSNFKWGTKDMFAGDDSDKVEREQDAADYKGPLMFRKEEKAPSREEIEKKEKAEESNKKSTLYTDDRSKGEGHRWDITKVEIPDANVNLGGDSNEPKKEFVGFKTGEDLSKPEPKKEFIGFAKDQEIEEEKKAKAVESKEELQAVLDQAIDQAIEKDFPSKREKKDIVFNWNQDIDIPALRDKNNEIGESRAATENRESTFINENESVSEAKETSFKGLGMEILDDDEDVVENNMSLTLEELSKGVNIKSDNVPASNYDQSKKTIRNVLSKEAIKKTINFSMDEINAQQEKIAREEAVAREIKEQQLAAEKAKKAEEEAAIEAMKMKAIRAARQAERAAKLELARAKAQDLEGGSTIVDIEQPKKSNISLEIHEDDVTGDKIEKVIDDEPKVPEETLKASQNQGFAHREINDDIKVGQVYESDEKSDDILEQILSPNKEIEEDNDKLKFYTFNKNKEEFQKLLDQEYKRLEGEEKDTEGFEADIAGFMNVERGKNIEATSQIEEMNKARSVFLNRPTYDDINVYDDEDFEGDILPQELLEDKESNLLDGQLNETATDGENAEYNQVEKDAIKENSEPNDDEITDDASEKVRIVFEPQKEESLAETLIEKEKAQDLQDLDVETDRQASEEPKIIKQSNLVKGSPEVAEEEIDSSRKNYLDDEVGKIIIDPKELSKTEKLASDFFDDEDETKERSKGKNFLIGLVTVIVVIMVALLGIKVIIPESPISKVMDDIGYKIVSTVTGAIGGDKDSEAKKKSFRETVIDDKTKLIQAEIDKNYNNNIEKIIEDSNLAYDSDYEYDLKDLVDAKDIQTVLWYEDNKGEPYYYDEELVGTIIEFISKKSAWQNKDDKAIFSIIGAGTKEYEKIASLEKNSSEKLVSVLAIGDIKVAGNAYYVWTAETVDDTTVERVYEIKEQDQKLYVNDDCEI